METYCLGPGHLRRRSLAPYPGSIGTNLQALRPFPQYTGINDQTPNIGNSNYNSFQLQLTRHFRNDFSLLVAYTFSKATSLTDNAIDAENVQDVFNRRLERSVSDYHFPQYFKATWIYELPIGPNKPLHVGGIGRRKLIGGWQLSGIHGSVPARRSRSRPAGLSTRSAASSDPTLYRARASSLTAMPLSTSGARPLAPRT